MNNWIEQYFGVFVDGIAVTILLSIVSTGAGIVFTVLIFFLTNLKVRILTELMEFVVEAIRACPPVVVLIWIFYAMPAAGLPALAPFPAAVLALGIYFAAFGSEILRGAIRAVPNELADHELMTARSRIVLIITFYVPDLWRRTFSAFNAQLISTIKNTSLASIITVSEVTYRAQIVATEVVKPFEVYSLLALSYLTVIMPVVFVLRLLERTRWCSVNPAQHDSRF